MGAGGSAQFDTMILTSLPLDMLEVIFATLALLDMACLGACCRTFRPFYCRQLAAERDARKELAANFYGVEQITRLTHLILKVLEGASLDRDPGIVDKKLDSWWYTWNAYCWRYTSQTLVPYEGNLHIRPQSVMGSLYLLPIKADDVAWSQFTLVFCRDRTGVWFRIKPSMDADLEGVGLVQAILDGGLAQYIQDVGKWVKVEVEVIQRYTDSKHISRAGLKAQIAHLYPASSRYTSEHKQYPMSEYFSERIHIGEE